MGDCGCMCACAHTSVFFFSPGVCVWSACGRDVHGYTSYVYAEKFLHLLSMDYLDSLQLTIFEMVGCGMVGCGTFLGKEWGLVYYLNFVCSPRQMCF